MDPNLPLHEQLNQWYAQTRLEFVDLMSQMGGSSGTFLIHAESMILRFSLDEKFCMDFLETPQFLRFIFTIEKFLQSILECGGSFRLVFFDNYKPLLEKFSPALWAVRQCLLLLFQVSSVCV